MAREPGGLVDLHNHLVPGVDDGSRTLEEAKDGLRRFLDVGVRTVVTTPHLEGSLTQNKGWLEDRLGEIDRAWDSLKRMAEAEFPELELLRGQEVMLDVPDPDLSDPRLRLAETSYVLVEWPGLRVPPSTLSVLDNLVESGVRPILAHPERYRGLDQGMHLPEEWRARGALLQVNYGSLLGRYGDLPRRLAWRFLEAGWVDLMASDYHGRPTLSPSLAEAGEALAELGGGTQFDLLAGVNPVRVLRDEDTLSAPPLAVKPRMFDRLRDMFQLRERW